MRAPQFLSRFPRLAWALLGLEGLLFLVFLAGMGWLWLVLPVEGVKLHGNVDTGVDLLGTREDLLWIAAIGAMIMCGNVLLAWVLIARERAAALFLLGATVPILLLLIGTVLFLANLNRLIGGA